MTHLGQRLSALIDGELDSNDRDRVLGHLARCDWCRNEAAAMRTLKRRMNALGEAAAGAGLTGRLMGLSADGPAGIWPQAPAGWPHAATSWPHTARPDSKAGRYFLAGSVVVFLASLSTAAFIAGGSPQARAPSPQVTPAVGAYLLEHANMSGLYLRRSQPNLNGHMQPSARKPGSKSPPSHLP